MINERRKTGAYFCDTAYDVAKVLLCDNIAFYPHHASDREKRRGLITTGAPERRMPPDAGFRCRARTARTL